MSNFFELLIRMLVSWSLMSEKKSSLLYSIRSKYKSDD